MKKGMAALLMGSFFFLSIGMLAAKWIELFRKKKRRKSFPVSIQRSFRHARLPAQRSLLPAPLVFALE